MFTRFSPFGWCCLLLIGMASAAHPASASASPQSSASESMLSDRAWLDAYCTFCHGKEKVPAPTAGLVLDADAVNVDDVSTDPAFWEKVLRRVRAATHPPANLEGTMYPTRGPGGTRVSNRTLLNAFVASIENKLDRRDAANWRPDVATRLGDRELAVRLASFLWGRAPDDELLRHADRGRLADPAVLEEQARRLLKDQRSNALIDRFFEQWLRLRDLSAVTRDPVLFPEFDDDLRRAVMTETRMFLEMQLREDRPVTELLTADYTFLNERLARHYGVPNIRGDRFRQVTLTGSTRAGLLGQASILMITSLPTRTSPVLRATWILDNLLGSPPARKPFVAPLKEEPNTSSRQRFEQHRRAPQCASCHTGIDPTGVTLENFDAVGRWRVVDGVQPVDTTGTFFDGTRLDGPVELRTALLDRRQAFVTTVVEQLLAHALARAVGPYDMPSVRTVVRDANRSGQRWSMLIVGVAKSTSFAMRRTR